MSLFVPLLFGLKDFDKDISSDELPRNLMCPHCHNNSVSPIKRREFFTVWFVPLIPIYWGKQLKCSICNWRQDIKKDEEEKLKQNFSKNG